MSVSSASALRSSGGPAIIDLRWPVILLILAATAVPIEWRSPANVSVGLRIDFVDAIENIAGYLPIGVAFASLGRARAILIAALLSLGAETSQFAMAHRHPSPVDVASNVLGATLGTLAALRYRLRPYLAVTLPVALLAVAGAILVGVITWTQAGGMPSDRGVSAPGRLEGYWKLDQTLGQTVPDATGHGLEGNFHGRPSTRHESDESAVVMFDGNDEYVDLGHPSALRLTGSMTLSARIRPSTNPPDDGAIVSSHNGLGFQLDTTVDAGPRTIGFKLGNSCARLMARYGATPLVLGRWYDVAGVYNAQAGTLDVYLDGQIDNGLLVGTVTGTQKSSRENVYIGRRADSADFGFRGEIRDVRIYSYSLTPQEIVANLRGLPDSAAEVRPSLNSSPRSLAKGALEDSDGCRVDTDPDDAKLTGVAATIGVLVAIACVGLFRTQRDLACFAAGLLAGLLTMSIASPTLPLQSRWLLAAICFMGCASAARCVRRSV